jgi:GTP-binding protein Era
MTGAAEATVRDVDAILFVTDGSPDGRREDPRILALLKEAKMPRIAVINKIDIVAPDEFRAIFAACEASGLFHTILGASAAKGVHVDKILAALEGQMPDGPMFFPEDLATDQPERFLAAEIIREKLLLYLEAEIPHGVAVELESYQEEAAITRIGAVVYCEKKSHKGMIIGKDGRKLKGVGKSARADIENLLGVKVFLQIWVKVRENWRDSDSMLRSLGYRADR